MNKLTPYEQSLSEQLTDLPLPAEDGMWQEMKKLLEEEKDRGPVVPPPSKRGCGLMSLLLLLGIAVTAVYFLKPQNWFNDKVAAQSESPVSSKKVADHDEQGNITQTKSSGETISGDINNISGSKDKQFQNADTDNSENGKIDAQLPATGKTDRADNKPSNSQTTVTTSAKAGTKGTTAKPKGPNGEVMPGVKNSRSLSKPVSTLVSAGAKNNKRNISSSTTKKDQINAKGKATTKITAADTEVEPETGQVGEPVTKIEFPADLRDTGKDPNVSGSLSKDSVPLRDSILAPSADIDTTAARDTTSRKQQKKKKYHFAAGLAVYQGIPLNGTLDFAVNNAGRKNALTDYIPSMYARFYKDKKWFIQGEFRYGVPQYSKGFIYKESAVTDSNQNTLTSSYKLHKTYYIQIPLSFNYYITPRWSIGTGLIYNRFTGALSAETVRKSNERMVNDSLVSFRLFDDKKDSIFKKNSFQWQIETQYQWKRFSFGARYAQGLQPYVKYNDPVTGLQVKRKYNSLNLFLRYELWKQKK